MTDKFVALKGGLDLVTPPLLAAPSAASEALNYFEAVKGGYTRLAGYERFDGQLPPHEAVYYLITINDWDLRVTPTPLTVGGSLVVDTATFTVLYLNESEDGTTLEVVGGEVAGAVPEDLEDNPLTFDTNCSITSAVHRGAEDEEVDTEYLNYARDVRRDLIGVVPGTGAIRGVAQIDGNAIAWRDDGTGKLLAYKASATGWQLVDYAQLVVCANTNEPIRGDVCNTATHTILSAFEYLDDAGNPDATKQVLAVHNTSGTALTTSDTLIRDSDSVTIGAVEALITYQFNPGGHVRPLLHNFYASAATRHLYCADGVSSAAVYKSSYNCLQPIASNYRKMEEVCSHLIAHNSRLWMATNYGTTLTSVADEPEVIDGFLGSAEWGVGDRVTGFSHTGADMLHTFTENTVQAVRGTSSADWTQYMVSDTAGARPDSIVTLDDVFAVAKRGITSLKRTNTLGGFAAATITDDIQPLIRELLETECTASVTIKGLNQMRFYFGDRFLMLSRVPYNANGNEGIRYGITEGLYPVDVSCAASGEDADGNERLLFGGDDGYVYHSDVGTSFDGGAIESTLTLHNNHLGAPGMRKRFRDLLLEGFAASLVNLRLYYSENDGRKTFSPKELTLEGGATGWDEGQFDHAIYDAYPLSRPSTRLVGTGHNIEFSFYHSDANSPSFTLTGYTLRYSNRGLTR